MYYLSRGEVKSESDHTVIYREKTFSLTRYEWLLWKNADCILARSVGSNFNDTECVLQKLLTDGLIATYSESNNVSDIRYGILAQSIIVPTPRNKVTPLLFGDEKNIIRWLTRAGFTLTIEEIVFLTENKITPDDNLLGEDNKQNLVATIYPDGKIENNILVKRMFHSAYRDYVVNIVFGMLKKKYIILN